MFVVYQIVFIVLINISE